MPDWITVLRELQKALQWVVAYQVGWWLAAGVAFAAGAVMLRNEKTEVSSKLAILLGVNFLSTQMITPRWIDGQVFLPTYWSGQTAYMAMREMVIFLLVTAWCLITQPTRWAYRPRRLTGPSAWLAMLLFSITSTIMPGALSSFCQQDNIFVSYSTAATIPCGLPLATLIWQRSASWCTDEPGTEAYANFGEIAMVLILTVSDALANFMRIKPHYMGAALCVGIELLYAITLALVGVLGRTLRLRPLDILFYKSILAFSMLYLPMFFYRYVHIGMTGAMTDWEILISEVRVRHTLIVPFLSWTIVHLFQRVLEYGIVQRVSASYMACASRTNENLEFLLRLSLDVIEFGWNCKEPGVQLPCGFWGKVTLKAYFANISAFTAFTVATLRKDRLVWGHGLRRAMLGSYEEARGVELVGS